MTMKMDNGTLTLIEYFIHTFIPSLYLCWPPKLDASPALTRQLTYSHYLRMGGEFVYTRKREKKQQTKDDQLYGYERYEKNGARATENRVPGA
jgi:hypothetical protein